MQVRGGLVLDMKSMNRVLAVTDDHIEVEAGAGWDVVLMAATERGRTPPIVTDWLKVSWGGPSPWGDSDSCPFGGARRWIMCWNWRWSREPER